MICMHIYFFLFSLSSGVQIISVGTNVGPNNTRCVPTIKLLLDGYIFSVIEIFIAVLLSFSLRFCLKIMHLPVAYINIVLAVNLYCGLVISHLTPESDHMLFGYLLILLCLGYTTMYCVHNYVVTYILCVMVCM